MKRYWVLCVVLWLSLASCVCAVGSQSPLYRLDNSGIDSGAVSATGGNTLVYQSVGPVFTSVSSASNKQLINGVHYSSNVYRIGGLQFPYTNLNTIGLSVSQNGLITSKIEYIAVANFVTSNIGLATTGQGSWLYSWVFANAPTYAPTASILARAYDGLSWGPWYETARLGFDSIAPTLNSFVLSSTGLALNSGLVNVSSDWTGHDNRPAALKYDVFLASNSFSPSSLSGLELWLDSADSSSIVESSGAVSKWMDKSGKDHDALQNASGSRPLVVQTPLGAMVTFDGIDDFLTWGSLSAKNNFTVFVVSKAQNNHQLDSESNTGMGGNSGQAFVLNPALFGAFEGGAGVSLGTNGVTVYEYGNSSFPPVGVYSGSVVGVHVTTLVYSSKTPTVRLDGSPLHTGLQSSATNVWAPTGVGGISGGFFKGDVAEILVFSRQLTATELQQVEGYLQFKWQVGDTYAWSPQTSQQLAQTWLASNKTDNTLYRVKIVATDWAGNQVVTQSAVILSPDRTPPKIGIVDAGSIVSALNSISGTEDVNWDFNLYPYKWDSRAYGNQLAWRVTPYTFLNPYKSTEPVFKNISILAPSDGVNNIHFIVSPNANTGDFIGASIAAGNRYGKDAAYAILTLTDAAGNSVSQDVRLHVAAVNDPPFFKDNVSDGTFYRDPNTSKLVYNVKFNEGTTLSGLRLDSFIDDVDDLISNVTITVSGNAYYQVGSVPYDANTLSVYKGNFMTFKVGNSTAGYPITLIPEPYWYGDQSVTINITDGHSISVNQPFVARIWPVNNPPIISSSLSRVWTVDEDKVSTLNLHAFENDYPYEDVAPTYNNKLNWTVESVDGNFVNQTLGQNSLSDILQFVPVANKYGTTNIVLKLTDTDDTPAGIFNKSEPTPYIPQPKTSTAAITLVWRPVNDAPEIGNIASQVKNEDSSSWVVDMDIQDVEDAYSMLDVSANILVNPAFPPISGLRLWLDAADSQSLVVSSSKVSQWTDKSGNGFNASQANVNDRPSWVLSTQKGRDMLRFNGSSSALSVPLVVQGNFSLMVVFKTNQGSTLGTQWTQGYGLLDASVSGIQNDFGMSVLNGKLSAGVGNPDTTLQGSLNVNDGQAHIAQFTRNQNTGEIQIYLDGNLALSGSGGVQSLSDASTMLIGAIRSGTGYFSGDIGEVIAFDKVLTPLERQRMTFYLQAKWGMADALVSMVMDKPNKKISFTPISNAFGTANVVLRAKDSDTGINFSPYTPSPIMVQRNFDVQLNPINDVPSLSGVTLQTTTPLTTKAKSTDTLQVFAQGYSDVGFSSNQLSAAYGSEYTTPDNPSIGFYKNSPLYNYRYTVVSGNSTLLSQDILENLTSSNTFAVSPSYEGATINIQVWPSDKFLDGASISRTVKVNRRPTLVNVTSPADDLWQNTKNVTLAWNAATDADNDSIGYRVKYWKVPRWDSPPPVFTVDSASDYDSGWQETVFTSLPQTLVDGTYYWAVYSGNKFSANQWDTREPQAIRHFHIDTTSPTFNNIVDTIFVKEIVSSTSNPVQDAGETRILYGQKPLGNDYNAGYKVVLDYTNTQIINGVTVVSHNVVVIVPFGNGADWTYQITYPAGNTVYNIYIEDYAGNKSTYHSFVIADDTTAPTMPTFNVQKLVKTPNGTLYAVTSANYFQFTGNKEAGSSLWYDDTQVVGFSNSDLFSFLVYPERPNGVIRAQDRAGNRSQGVTINISFLQGSPTLTLMSQNRNVINSPTNSALANVDASVKDFISKSEIRWKPDRLIKRYEWINTNGGVVQSGTTVNAATEVLSTIYGNSPNLKEGLNTLTLQAWDRAGSKGVLTVPISLFTKAPTTNIILYGEASLNAGKWKVDITGKQVANATVYMQIDGQNQYIANYANNTWKYVNTDFDLQNKDLVLKVIDNGLNEASRTVWNHSQFGSGSGSFKIAAVDDSFEPYDRLPAPIIKLFTRKLDQGILTAQSQSFALSTQEALKAKMKEADYVISPVLKSSMIQVYGKTFTNDVVPEVVLDGYNIRMKMTYPSSIEIEPSKIVAVYFNPTTKQWEKPQGDQVLNMEARTVTVPLQKTGLWALAEYKPFATNLQSVRVYPNPWVPNDNDPENGTLAGGITFDQLTATSRISIYTLSGQLVREANATGVSTWTWDGKNNAGRDVFSGVYLYVISDGTSKKTGKVTVIR